MESTITYPDHVTVTENSSTNTVESTITAVTENAEDITNNTSTPSLITIANEETTSTSKGFKLTSSSFIVIMIHLLTIVMI